MEGVSIYRSASTPFKLQVDLLAALTAGGRLQGYSHGHGEVRLLGRLSVTTSAGA